MLIRVVDLETTGFEPPAGICEIGFCDLVRDGDEWIVGRPANLLVNPGHPIPPETSAVHHITDDDVIGAPDIKVAIAPVLHDEERFQARRVVLVAHNARFERQWLTPEVTGDVEWVCTYKCALTLWPDAPAHNNGTLRYWLKPAGLDRAMADPAHRAGPDAYVTAFILREMLKLASLDELVRISSRPALLPRCNFGKHRGTAWADVPSDYLRWVTGQQMDEDVLHTAQHHLAARAKR
ncbi:exonuclease domain-containing protein [Methylobacterium gossipiicola]|uniref:Exodeoxyribonuclease X n=1 Tax=Methylobacterium gossipiicola TaxID=582675 RepID=A0A1I2TL45_9HYPH|nr:exonuclease domain-containing protein [Methylobacterium gossipiicola]SFG65665.1 exodeoxyribonuclease X [Methylobacterium gossipiicola]